MEHSHFKEKVEALSREMATALHAAISEFGHAAVKRKAESFVKFYTEQPSGGVWGGYFTKPMVETAKWLDELFDELEKERREEGEI